MDEPDVVEVIGRGLFGSGQRLRLALWIEALDDDEFYGDQYCSDVSRYAQPGPTLRRLEELGLIIRLPFEEQTRRAYRYRRVPTALWQIITATRAALSDYVLEASNADERAFAAARNELLRLLVDG